MAEGIEIADEPLVIVGEIVDLVGHDPVADEMGVIDPGRGLLLPGGVGVALQLRIGVAGHVPHVGDAGGGGAALRRRLQGERGILAVPEMDQKVVRGMIRVFCQDLLGEQVHRVVARDGQLLSAVVKDLVEEEGLGLDLTGVFLKDLLERTHVVAETFFGVRLGILEVGGESVDPEFLTIGGLGFPLDRLVDELLPAGVVLEVRHRHAPVEHRRLGIEFRGLAEAALGLEKPVTVELPDALGEETASFLRFCCHLEMDFARAGDEHGGLARALVEDFAVVGVTGGGGVGFFGRFLPDKGQGETDAEQQKTAFHAAQSGLMKTLRNWTRLEAGDQVPSGFLPPWC